MCEVRSGIRDPKNPWVWVAFWLIVLAAVARIGMELWEWLREIAIIGILTE